MANRKWHLIMAIIVFIIYCIIYYLVDTKMASDLPDLALLWVVTALLLILIGAEAPDWDLLLSWMHHRDIITHSVIIPLTITVLFLIQYFMDSNDPTLILALVFAPFCLEFASHLLLDLFPSVDPVEEAKEHGLSHTATLLLGGFVSGLTGLETIKALQGAYLVHLPFKMKVRSEKKQKKWEIRKTLPLRASRWWLFISGVITGLLGILLMGILVWV